MKKLTLVLSLIIFSMNKSYSQTSSRFYYNLELVQGLGEEISYQIFKFIKEEFQPVYSSSYAEYFDAKEAYCIDSESSHYFLLILNYDDKIKAYTYNDLLKIIEIKEKFRPFSTEFIREIPNLITELSYKLNVPTEILDKSIKSIITLDEAISRLKKDEGKVFFNQRNLFLPLFAYIGEVIIREKRGKWHLDVKNREDNLYVTDDKDNRYDIYYILNDLFDHIGDDVTVLSIINIILNPVDLKGY